MYKNTNTHTLNVTKQLVTQFNHYYNNKISSVAPTTVSKI